MVDRLVAVDDADYRLPTPVRQALATDAGDSGTELGGVVSAVSSNLVREETLALRPKVERTRQYGVVRTLATGDHNAFAYAVKLPNTSNLVAWRKGANHTPSKGSIYAARYDVFGDIAMAATAVITNATLDLRDPGLTVLSDGRILLSWFRYDPAGAGTPLPDALRVAYSNDNGATFGAEVSAPTAHSAWVASAGPAVEMLDGALILPAYGMVSGESWQSAKLSRSVDGGATWTPYSHVAGEDIDQRHWQEINILLMSSGDLLAAIRTEGAVADIAKQTIWTARSVDGGATWTEHTDQFAGSGAPRLTEMNGIVYVVYRDRVTGRPAQRASLDFGRSWGAPIELPNLAGASPAKPSMVYGNAIAYGNDSLRYWYTLQSADTFTADLVTVDAIVPDDRLTKGPGVCRIRNAAGSVPVATGTWTPITFDTEDIDTAGFHNSTTNTSRVTVPAGMSGHYLVTGSVYFASGSPTQVQCAVRKNGVVTAIPGLRAKENPTAAGDSLVSVSGVVRLDPGDFLELFAYQDAGVSLGARYEDTTFTVTLISPRV